MTFNKNHYFFISLILSSSFAQASLSGTKEERLQYMKEIYQADQESIDNAFRNSLKATPVKPSLHDIRYASESIENIKKLIIDGVDLNEMDPNLEHGHTPLIKALVIEREDITKLLLEKGASVNQPDRNGRTPIQVALLHGIRTLNLIKLILDYNPQLNFEYKPIGETPLAHAIVRRKEAIIFLLQKGAILKPEHFELSNAINLVTALNKKLGFADDSAFIPYVKIDILTKNLIKRSDLITYLKTNKKIKKLVGTSFVVQEKYQTIVDELAAQSEYKLYF